MSKSLKKVIILAVLVPALYPALKLAAAKFMEVVFPAMKDTFSKLKVSKENAGY